MAITGGHNTVICGQSVRRRAVELSGESEASSLVAHAWGEWPLQFVSRKSRLLGLADNSPTKRLDFRVAILYMAGHPFSKQAAPRVGAGEGTRHRGIPDSSGASSPGRSGHERGGTGIGTVNACRSCARRPVCPCQKGARHGMGEWRGVLPGTARPRMKRGLALRMWEGFPNKEHSQFEKGCLL